MQVRRSNNAPFGRVEKSVALGILAIAEFPAKVFITLMDVRSEPQLVSIKTLGYYKRKEAYIMIRLL